MVAIHEFVALSTGDGLDHNPLDRFVQLTSLKLLSPFDHLLGCFAQFFLFMEGEGLWTILN